MKAARDDVEADPADVPPPPRLTDELDLSGDS